MSLATARYTMSGTVVFFKNHFGSARAPVIINIDGQAAAITVNNEAPISLHQVSRYGNGDVVNGENNRYFEASDGSCKIHIHRNGHGGYNLSVYEDEGSGYELAWKN